MAEKSEKATPKKLRDARKKGQVAKIQDFPAVFTFIVSMGGVLASATYLYEVLATFMLEMFRSVANPDFEGYVAGYLTMALQAILKASLPLMVIVALVGMLTTFLIVGPVFSFEAMKFDLKKLNPVEGIKQKFKLKVLIELLKSVLKISGAAYIIYRIIWGLLPQIIGSVTFPPIILLSIVADFFLKATIQVGVFFLAVALFDLAFQKHQFSKDMKMEKFEVKQEYKDTEGDPHIKYKRRELFREIAYQEGPAAAKKARVIVSNPTHIAVALKYDEVEDPAPIILTMGVGKTAEEILKIGLENKIPIMRNIELARGLFTKGQLGQYVPEDMYGAIAEVLKWVKSLEGAEKGTVELFQ